MYQFQTRMTDILNYPLLDRVRQMVIFIETAPIKDLEAFYSTLVHSIFGSGFGQEHSVGWGLRAVTDRNMEFKVLYDFFHPHGAFFALIYRLLKDTVKYEIKLSELPVKLRQMLESGRHSSFYTNVLNVDNFQPRNMALSLNAFDFFMFHFCIHGMKNLHKISPAAANVNNENLKTVYFCLTADYLCNFIPSDPNAIIYPQIEGFPVKAHSAVPMPTNAHPTKPPKYLMLSALSHQIQNPTNARDLKLPEAVRSTNWRSESVMIIFIDCWLRYDIDESWELPGNEFIRMVRILVKQIHFFGNVAEQDMSSLSVLRQQAQSLLNLRIYPFLKTIISRWPLDTSFINVLELWLSYIQPWRYLFNRNIQSLNNEIIEVPHRFKVFISENIICYTQIFVKLIPRFLKMDLGLTKNAFMLFRMMKVFRQLDLVLRDIERNMMNNSTNMRSQSTFNDTSIHSSPPRAQNSFNRSGERVHHRSHNLSAVEDSNYMCLFGDEITIQIYEIMQRLFAAKVKTQRDIEKTEKDLNVHTSIWNKFLQFIGWLSSLSLSFSMAFEEKKKTPIYLDFCLDVFSGVFNIPVSEVVEISQVKYLQEESDDEQYAGSDILNMTPSFMKQRLHNITYTGDPFLLPVRENEVRCLVRFFHQVSCKVNEMFGNEFDTLWNRQDFYGKFFRQVLSPPVETRVFDKSAGFSEMKVQQIGPRLSLRTLACQKFIMFFILAFLFGRLFLGASSLGFVTFTMIAFGYLMIKAAISN